MDIDNFSGEVRANSRGFQLLLRKIREATGVDEVFDKEIQGLLSYLEMIGTEKQLIGVIGGQLKYHTFKKFFLGYNSYKIFQKGAGIPGSVSILCLGELLSIPIIFMDDIMDSHYSRNNRPTPYSYFHMKYNKAKEYTFFYSNIILNYLIGKLMLKEIHHSLRESLLKSYIDCANKTYTSPIYEQNTIPEGFEDVLEVYRKKSYHFTTYFISCWGSLLGNGKIERRSLLERVLLDLTYLVSIKNDAFDFIGDGRWALEDTINHSNTFALYMLKKSLKSDSKVKSMLKRRDKKEILPIMNSGECKREILKRSIQIRNSIKVAVGGYDGRKAVWFRNYLLYADFLLKDLMDNLKYVQ